MKHQWRKKAAAAQRMKKGTSSIYFLLAIWFVLPAQTLNPTEMLKKWQSIIVLNTDIGTAAIE